ncbi:MAG TPA: FAD-binding and (Fe-S)-binding domain-containing protein [Gammaproteobacteria bacterium]|nr:FAD-binding and (Fe-S)-binding domain-containing protein [Gammaproteobacteria bacterium]
MLPRITPDDTVNSLYQNYLDVLRSTDFSGEIKTDYATRLTVSTDNSIYQVIPQAVLFPRSTRDISIILKLGNQKKFHKVKFSPRGGGTCTNGQSLSAGIIIDCSKHMRNILEINLEERWVKVQPGVILDQLTQYLKPFNVQFAIEISPSNRATLGGMINTDACGNGSKILGRTSDHVLELTCVMHDGKILQTQDVDDAMEKTLSDMLLREKALIQEKFIKTPRTLSGYNLAKAYQNKLNLNYLLCGSEGTLAVVCECKLKLTPLPKFRKLIVIKYRTFEEALFAAEITDNIKPLIIETIDEKLISLAHQDSIYFYIKDFIQDAKSINLVEFIGDDETEINQQISELCKNIDNSTSAIGFYLAQNEAEIKLLWELRKKSVGLISKRKDGTRRPIPFIEDTAVPPEKLADYIAEFKKLLDQHQLIYGMYGHIDAGCMHVRPALDTRLHHDEKLIQILSDKVVELVKKYGGVIWGEHGKGYRSEYGKEFFGETLYHILRQIKTLFDPNNQLNPGKIATPLDSEDNIVKVSGPMRGHFDREISSRANNEYASAIACNGNGACFNFQTQEVMCPSYKVTKERIHSPKGRAVIIREWIRQLSIKNYTWKSDFSFLELFEKIKNFFYKGKDFSHEAYTALEGCLACKACANQCPLNVDIPDLKSKFLSQYHRRYFRKPRDYLIANIENLARFQSKFPRFCNILMQNSFIKKLCEVFFKLIDFPFIDSSNMPEFISPPNSSEPDSIIILQDVFTSFYEKNVLKVSCDFFKSIGFTVYVAPFFPNGKPFHVQGFLNHFNKISKRNIRYLRNLASLNIPLIGLEPSITLTYRDEYQKILGNEKLGFSVLLPQEFLQTHLGKLPKISPQKNYYLLSHCTEKTSQIESEKQWQTIFTACGLNLVPLTAGCCGMAGSYGHELEHFNNSHELFNMDWQQHIQENSDTEKYLLATGYSCRSQTKRFSQIKLRHPLEALLLY